MSGGLPWHRASNSDVDDGRLKLLAFDDRWFVYAFRCLRGQGLVDETPITDLRRRLVAAKLGLALRELDEVVRRIAAVELIDPDTYEPVNWIKSQAPRDPTAKIRKQREREKRALRRVTATSRVTHRDGHAIDTDVDIDLDTDETTTTVATVDLVWPSEISTGHRKTLERVVVVDEGLSGQAKQDVIDEFAGRIRVSKPPESPSGWLQGSAAAAKRGEFVLSYGLVIRAERERRAAEAKAAEIKRADAAAAEVRRNDPAARVRADAARRETAEMLGLHPRPSTPKEPANA